MRTRIRSSAAVLGASAFVLAGLVVVQAGRLPGNAAYAETSSEAGGYSLLTIDSGRGDDASPDELFYVLDSRDQVLLVYEIEDARSKRVLLRTGASLAGLFGEARRQ